MDPLETGHKVIGSKMSPLRVGRSECLATVNEDTSAGKIQ